MSSLVTINGKEVSFEVVGNQTFTTSLDIASVFEKRHSDILAQIRALPQDNFNALNFKAVEYLDQKGELRPCYNLTRDGFSLLVMGFTGEKAYRWKIEFLKAFNKMEEMIKSKDESLSEIDLLIKQATLLKQNQQKLKNLEVKTNDLHKEQLKTKHNINRLLSNDNYMTVIAYANLKGIPAKKYNASALGKKATNLSKKLNLPTGAVIDPRFGSVKTYSVEVLSEVFGVLI